MFSHIDSHLAPVEPAEYIPHIGTKWHHPAHGSVGWSSRPEAYYRVRRLQLRRSVRGATLGGSRSAGARPGTGRWFRRAIALTFLMVLLSVGGGGAVGAAGRVAPSGRVGVGGGRGSEGGPCALAAGNGHSCAVCRPGPARCWGLNGDGELGNGSTADAGGRCRHRSHRRAVDHCRRLSPCAALIGGVRCWGYNFHGELASAGRARPSAPAGRACRGSRAAPLP